MSRQSRVIVVSAALLAGLIGVSGIAQADAVRHRGHAARTVHPIAEAMRYKLSDQKIYGLASAERYRNVYGLAIANPESSCDDITCPGFALLGIGF